MFNIYLLSLSYKQGKDDCNSKGTTTSGRHYQAAIL